MSDQFKHISICAHHLQQVPRCPPKPLTSRQCALLHRILDRISVLSEMPPESQQVPKIRFHLLVFMGFYPRLRYKYRFPYPFPERAAALLRKFKNPSLGTESHEAGSRENPVVLDDTVDTDDTMAPVKRVVRVEEAVNLDENISPSESIVRPIDSEQPIFGPNGIMRGITISVDRRQYSIDEAYRKKRANKIGHNNLKVGDWWPKQICALRDGAHGAKISGISGNSDDGAFSIVLSGTYDNLDADRGDILYYCGSHSLVNKNPTTPIKSCYTNALRHSIGTKQPVRVLRSARSNSPWSPSHGIRYDGLYVVTGEETKRNTLGGAYARFRMDRIVKQPAIDMKRPTKEEVELYKRIFRGP